MDCCSCRKQETQQRGNTDQQMLKFLEFVFVSNANRYAWQVCAGDHFHVDDLYHDDVRLSVLRLLHYHDSQFLTPANWIHGNEEDDKMGLPG